jgi:hypothetical protein
VKYREVNSLTYCTQAVIQEAEAMAKGGVPRETKPPFGMDELRSYLTRNASALQQREGFKEIADSLEKLAAEAEQHYSDLERLEQHLTVLEEKMSAIAKASQTESDMLQARRELDATLRPYRSKMTADQLAMLERQYLERALLEKASLPRLSLFYLR